MLRPEGPEGLRQRAGRYPSEAGRDPPGRPSRKSQAQLKAEATLENPSRISCQPRKHALKHEAVAYPLRSNPWG